MEANIKNKIKKIEENLDILKNVGFRNLKYEYKPQYNRIDIKGRGLDYDLTIMLEDSFQDSRIELSEIEDYPWIPLQKLEAIIELSKKYFE